MLTSPRPTSARGDANDAFVPNGLLGGSSALNFGASVLIMPVADADDDGFAPNGLLSDASRTLVDISQISLEDAPDFMPSGLLGGTTSPPSTQGVSPAPDNTNPATDADSKDEMPSISQLLPLSQSAGPTLELPRASNVSPHLIRGSNYKGKAVYFSKRYRRTTILQVHLALSCSLPIRSSVVRLPRTRLQTCVTCSTYRCIGSASR
jgi:hypothetical protein